MLPSAAFAVQGAGDIILELDSAQDTIGGYRLVVSRHGIRISAGSYGGVIAGIATLGQLVPGDGSREITALEIEDSPRFAWRGFMLDVARHFFTKEEVLALLDKMAQYKFNKFHWHLTDDQGWRIEIRRYPELTARGAWRDPGKHNNDIVCRQRARDGNDETYLLPAKNFREVEGKNLYGGYYTQEEIREVVAYAAALGIDVIPELDMPGHSLKIIESHPEFSCRGKAGWGETFSTPLCLGNDALLDFCKDIYSEVFDLFPFGFVHLGADEVEKTEWKSCPKCQARIASNGLADEYELQAWFVREMEHYFNAHGRRLIGWDEITRGGLSRSAVVQWWRSWMPGTLTDALENGNRVFLSPSEFMYLSVSQDRDALLKVYNYEPLEGVAEKFSSQIFGVHANLWTEYIPTFDRACYQIFPRFFAASEVAWSQPQLKDDASFVRRVNTHLKRLDADGWYYRIPDLSGFCDENVFVDTTTVEIVKPYDGIEVRYTTDGSIPDTSSLLYTSPVAIASDCTLRFRSYTALGKAGDVVTAHYRKTGLREATVVGRQLDEGLSARWYDYKGEACSQIGSAPFKAEYVTSGVYIPHGVSGSIGLIFTGFFEARNDGIYSFYTYTDDGSTLMIGEVTVVDNDGPHPRVGRSGQIALRKGLHPIEVRYFDSNGGILEAGMIDTDGVRRPFDGKLLWH